MSGPLLIDITNLQWWQALLGIIAALGLSPAPWILGLVVGRLQFTLPAKAIYDERIQDLKDGHAVDMMEVVRHHAAELGHKDEIYRDMKESRDGYKISTKEERNRADKATDALATMVDALKATNHFAESFHEVTTSTTPTPILGGDS